MIKTFIEEALKYSKKAAEQGHAESQAVVGVIYFRGKGVTQSYKEAT